MVAIFHVLRKAKLYHKTIWEAFQAQEITDKTMRCMTFQDIKDIFTTVGRRVAFEDERSKWLKDPQEYIQIALDDEEEEEESLDEFSPEIKYNDETFDLVYVLKKDVQANHFLKLYQENRNDKNEIIHRPLLKRERKLLSATIINYFINKTILLSRNDFSQIFYKIQDIFKRALKSIYYLEAYMRTDKIKKSKQNNQATITVNLREKQHQTKGKKKGKSEPERVVITYVGPSGILYNAYRYRITKIRKTQKLLGENSDAYYKNISRKGNDSNYEDFEEEIPDEDCESIKIWLQENHSPWDTVKIKWEKTCSYRRLDLHDENSNFDFILKEWPRYKKQYGYELLEIDFDNMYPEAAPKFKRFWPEYCNKIIDVAIAAAECSRDKDSVLLFSTRAPINDEEQNWLSRLALHGIHYLIPTKNKNCEQVLEKIFLKVERGTRIVEKIQELSEIANDNNEEFSPFILYFEDENLIPYKFFVCINLLIYESNNFVTALNILFKSYYVFHCIYPDKCKVILTFIQHFYYQIFSSNDINSSTLVGVMHEIDQDRSEHCQNNMVFKRSGRPKKTQT
ncbi:hypothetical protein ACFFRR_003349 [Megaselia abdita]